MLTKRSPSARTLKLTPLPFEPFCPGLTHSIPPPCFHTVPQPGWCPARQWAVILVRHGSLPCWLLRPPTPACLPACRRPKASVSAWGETLQRHSRAALTAHWRLISPHRLEISFEFFWFGKLQTICIRGWVILFLADPTTETCFLTRYFRLISPCDFPADHGSVENQKLNGDFYALLASICINDITCKLHAR